MKPLMWIYSAAVVLAALWAVVRLEAPPVPPAPPAAPGIPENCTRDGAWIRHTFGEGEEDPLQQGVAGRRLYEPDGVATRLCMDFRFLAADEERSKP